MDAAISLPLDRCWSRIGITGDRTCPELTQIVHCRNCLVHQVAGRSLLEREISEDYLEAWTDLEDELEARTTTRCSVVIFRLEAEWFALPALCFKEVTSVAPVHTLPHRSNAVLRGLVNIRGELQLCLSLTQFLGLELNPAQTTSRVSYQRMVIVEKEGNTWVFVVDELYGVQPIYSHEIESLPGTASKARETYTRGILRWNNQTVSYLDDELLFYALARRVLG